MREILYVLAMLPCLLLAGCVENGRINPSVQLPHAPSYYLACFKKLTPIPVSDLTREKVVELVAELRRSELAKSQCGKDLLAWYETVRASYGRR